MHAERPALHFTFNNVRFDRGGASAYYEILLGVAGDFAIIVAGKTLYVEEEFCLAEFAAALAEWWQRRASAPSDFSYDSLESDEDELVWIRTTAGHGRIGARYQEYEETYAFPLNVIGAAIQEYVTALQQELAARFAIDWHAFLRLHTEQYRS